jgi:hypothetical protein
VVKKESRICLYLFGKPAWELEGLEGEELSAEFASKLEELGKDLNERLHYAAKVLRELTKHGWSAYGTLYDIDFTKEIPKEEAEKELKKLELDLEVEEEEFEEEEFEEEFEEVPEEKEEEK